MARGSRGRPVRSTLYNPRKASNKAAKTKARNRQHMATVNRTTKYANAKRGWKGSIARHREQLRRKLVSNRAKQDD